MRLKPTYTQSKLEYVQQEAIRLLQPYQKIEFEFLEDPSFLEGLDWGIPRYGHPEGKIMYHIEEVLTNVHSLKNLEEKTRQQLRIIAFVHDTFKYMEDKARPRNWKEHHSIFARDFLAYYTSDQVLLDIIELHDEAYYIWRLIYLQHQPERGELRKQKLLNRIGDHIQLYYLFFKCDTMTGDKMPAPLDWFETEMKGIEVVELEE